MRKLLLPLLSILLFTACQKEVTTTKEQEEIAGASANKLSKITVCHYDPVTSTSKTIQVDQSALAGHLGHGDVQGECTTTICDQVWMVKNLDVDHYRNGDPIPEVTNPTEWAALTTGAWCYYENTSTNGTRYGKLYNWYAVHDPRGLAPIGWHVPTTTEWFILSICLGGFNEPIAGGKMKSVGTIEAGTGLWREPNTDATNSSGFTGLPGGLRILDGSFENIGDLGVWWSSEEYSSTYIHFLHHNSGDFSLANADNTKQSGASVRCLRD